MAGNSFRTCQQIRTAYDVPIAIGRFLQLFSVDLRPEALHSKAHVFQTIRNHGDHSEWSLPATVKDMQPLRSVLIDQSMCGCLDDEAHIRLLHDSGATRKTMLDGLK